MSYSENEYIKLNRKIVNWEWFCDPNTAHLFIFCLLSANWKDGRFQGKEIKRGSFVTSLDKIKVGTGLSIQQIRTALDKLQATGEITNKSYTKYRIITVCNYDMYQSDNKQNNKQNNKQVTNNQQTNNKQVTNNQQTNNKQVTIIEEYIRSKEDEELKKRDLLNISDDIFNRPSDTDKKHESPYQEYLDLWNSLKSYGIAPLRAISEQRAKLLKPRLEMYGKDSFAECIEQIKQSDFLQGKHGGKPWTITFDWMIKPSNYPKVLEGNYRNKNDSGGNNQQGYLSDIMQMIGSD